MCRVASVLLASRCLALIGNGKSLHQKRDASPLWLADHPPQCVISPRNNSGRPSGRHSAFPRLSAAAHLPRWMMHRSLFSFDSHPSACTAKAWKWPDHRQLHPRIARTADISRKQPHDRTYRHNAWATTPCNRRIDARTIHHQIASETASQDRSPTRHPGHTGASVQHIAGGVKTGSHVGPTSRESLAIHSRRCGLLLGNPTFRARTRDARKGVSRE